MKWQLSKTVIDELIQTLLLLGEQIWDNREEKTFPLHAIRSEDSRLTHSSLLPDLDYFLHNPYASVK